MCFALILNNWRDGMSDLVQQIPVFSVKRAPGISLLLELCILIELSIQF